MKKNANNAAKRNRRNRNPLALTLAALLGAALIALPTDAAKADDFGFSLNLGCFSLNIGSTDDCRDCPAPLAVAPAPAPQPIVVAPVPAPKPIVVAPAPALKPIVVAPAPAPKPIVVAPAPAPKPIALAPAKPAPKPIALAPAKPAPKPIALAPAKPATKAPAVVRGQAPKKDARATYSPIKAARAPRR